MRITRLVLLLFAVLVFRTGTQHVKAVEKAPDADAVKKYMTPAQLALGDPIDTSIGMVLVPIPSGEFQMGSPASEAGRDEEKPQHLVKITNPFYLSVHEVTQLQYEKVMSARPWKGKRWVQDEPDSSVTYVSWDDAVEFCRKLSEQERGEFCLPTEAQWEYACRAGTTTTYSFGNEVFKLGDHAWYFKNSWYIGEDYAHPVGQKRPNPWGLFDMHGNVWEWCQDRYEEYGSLKAQTNTTRRLVLRGGSFADPTDGCRSACRRSRQHDNFDYYLGFRVSRTFD